MCFSQNQLSKRKSGREGSLNGKVTQKSRKILYILHNKLHSLICESNHYTLNGAQYSCFGTILKGQDNLYLIVIDNFL